MLGLSTLMKGFHECCNDTDPYRAGRQTSRAIAEVAGSRLC